jgi:phospholipid/cholesterol/gamma-HCH transport system substrate-binding protein
MKKFNVEIAVGVFMFIGFLCFAYISIKLGDINLFGKNTYAVSARFNSVSGLKEGAPIELAGVQVGKVSRIELDPENYEAVVHMQLDKGLRLQEDSIASIRTAGLIGDKYVKISPGGLDELIEEGGELFETESAVSLEELISKYIFNSE